MFAATDIITTTTTFTTAIITTTTLASELAVESFFQPMHTENLASKTVCVSVIIKLAVIYLRSLQASHAFHALTRPHAGETSTNSLFSFYTNEHAHAH